MAIVNEFVKYPKVGDHCVGVLETSEKKYISSESFDYDALDKNVYEILGVVFYRNGNTVKIVAGEEASRRFCNYCEWVLSGCTLDGAARQFTLNAVTKANWDTTVPFTIRYQATTIEQLASQIEAAMQADEVLREQDWHCFVKDGKVKLTVLWTTWHQHGYNRCSDGASIALANFESIGYDVNILRRNGYYSGNGVISNFDKAVAFYRPDTSDTNYNPTTIPANLKRDYAVCLPCYLGTSKYNSPSVEKCAGLRAKYGEGEEGWLRYLRSFMAVLHTDRFSTKPMDGMALTKEYFKYVDYKGDKQSPAAEYAMGYGKRTNPAGSWYIPTAQEAVEYLQYVHYPTKPNDVLNDSLLKQKSSRISNGAYYWLCSRCSIASTWLTSGNSGLFNSNYSMYVTNAIRLISTFKIK